LTRYLFDSDVCIDMIARRFPAASERRFAGSELHMSVISYGEVLEGILHSRARETEWRTWREFVEPFAILNVDVEIAEIWAELRGQLRMRGERLPDNDLIIASTALHHRLVLVTRNERHFARIPGLHLQAG
jgi:tRNA(fMet)-specific endonuclease VapC